MVTARIDASSSSDAVAEARNVGRRLRAGGLAPELADRAAAEVEAILVPLVASARLVAARGSRMEVTQTVTGPGYSVVLRVAEGVRPTIAERLGRLLSKVSGRK